MTQDHRYHQLLHSRIRAWEHFKVALSDRDVNLIVARIKQGGTRRIKYVCQGSNRREVWLVGWGKLQLPVIYDPKTEMLATVLPNLDRVAPKYRSECLGNTHIKKLREAEAARSDWRSDLAV